MKSQTKPLPSLPRLLRQWQAEHRELERLISEIQWWTTQAAQSGQPRYGEMAEKLGAVREHLFQHFDREAEIGWELPTSSVDQPAEVEAVYRQAADDHQQLLERLDRLIDHLQTVPPRFESWQDAVDELDLFLDSLDEHEESEETSIQWLTGSEFDSDQALH